MGLLDKIEDKLSGGKHEQKKLEKNELKNEQGYDNEQSGSRSHGLRHPVQANDGYGNVADQNAAGPHGAYGGQSGRDKMLPQEPYDPKSSRGQDAAYHASSGGQINPEDYGNERTGHSRDHKQHHLGRDAAGVGAAGAGAYELDKHHREHERRHPGESQTGGYSGAGEPGMQDYGRSSADNGRSGHHFGRDAPVAGTGAAGVGAYEADKHHRDQRRHPNEGQAGGFPTSGEQDFGRQSADNGRSGHHYGRDAAGVGAAGVGAYELDKHHREHRRDEGQDGAYPSMGESGHSHGHHQHGQQQGMGTQGPTGGMAGMGAMGSGAGEQGLPTEKKLGGAYEAGYRDAMAHMQAEQSKQNQF